MQGMQIQSLGWEDPLEEEMATHSSILAWEIPWTREPGGLQSTGRKESDTTDHEQDDKWGWGIPNVREIEKHSFLL